MKYHMFLPYDIQYYPVLLAEPDWAFGKLAVYRHTFLRYTNLYHIKDE